MFKGEREP